MDKMVGIILSIVFVVFLLALAIGFIELSTPIALKADFDRICDTYVDTAVDQGGLTAPQINSLVTELEAISPALTINSTTISRVGTVAYKSDITFTVKATYSRSTMINLMVRELRSYNFTYDKTFANSVLVE